MKWTKSRKLLSEHIKNSSKMSQKWCWDVHATRIQSSKNARDLWQPERRQQRVHHWSSSFIVDQTRALACTSFSFLHEYDVKLQISLFMEDVKTPDDDILFLFFFRKPWELHSRKSFFSGKIRDGITQMEFETARIALLSGVFAAVAVVPRSYQRQFCPHDINT